MDYYPGSEDTNVILSAPHDGWIKLDSIPDRRQVRTAAIPVNFIYEEISLKALYYMSDIIPSDVFGLEMFTWPTLSEVQL